MDYLLRGTSQFGCCSPLLQPDSTAESAAQLPAWPEPITIQSYEDISEYCCQDDEDSKDRFAKWEFEKWRERLDIE